MKVMRDSNLITEIQPEPLPQQWADENSMPTPPICSDDCAMDDIELVEPVALLQSTWSTVTGLSLTKPTKRKFLADRDENVPTSSSRSKISKRQRSGADFLTVYCEDLNRPLFEVKQVNHFSCRNCGHRVQAHEWDNLNGCIHHPGNYNGKWSCCNSEEFVPGCIVSRHQELDLSAWKTNRGVDVAEHFKPFNQHGFGLENQSGLLTPTDVP